MFASMKRSLIDGRLRDGAKKAWNGSRRHWKQNDR
jgi:hypothetical protein